MGYIRSCEGYGFRVVYCGIGCINQRVYLQNRVLFSRKLIKWLKILVQTRKTGIATQKYERLKSLCLGWTVFVTSVGSGKQLLWDRGRFWDFSLVQGSKIHFNELWYRLRVPESQRHIPTQKNPPPPALQRQLSDNGFFDAKRSYIKFKRCVRERGLKNAFPVWTYPLECDYLFNLCKYCDSSSYQLHISALRCMKIVGCPSLFV